MRGTSRANAERKQVVDYYRKHDVGVEKLAHMFNIPRSTVYHWIRPVARTRARYRKGDYDTMIDSLNRARLRVYYGSSIVDAIRLEDVSHATYYRYFKEYPFLTQFDLLTAEIANLFKSEHLSKEDRKIVERISRVVYRLKRTKTALPRTNPETIR